MDLEESNYELDTTEEPIDFDSEVLNTESEELTEPTIDVEGDKVLPSNDKKKLTQLPLGKVKRIMKLDPDCQIVSQEAACLITKATELFVHYMGRESVKYTKNAKRKTVLRRDVDSAVDSIPHLCFLEGALE